MNAHYNVECFEKVQRDQKSRLWSGRKTMKIFIISSATCYIKPIPSSFYIPILESGIDIEKLSIFILNGHEASIPGIGHSQPYLIRRGSVFPKKLRIGVVQCRHRFARLNSHGCHRVVDLKLLVLIRL